MEYRVVIQGVDAKRKLYDINTPLYSIIGNNRHQDWYESIFIYNEAAKDKLEFSKSLAGIKDVYTNKLVWDFDSKDNLELAREDAVELIYRLTEKGISDDDIKVWFSGMKGYTVQVLTDEKLSVPQFQNICLNLSENLKTSDPSLYDPQRILRIPGTQHAESKLYKIPISGDDLLNYDSAHFMSLAKDPNNANVTTVVSRIKLPRDIIALKDSAPKPTIVSTPKYTQDVSSLDFTVRPRGLSACKWALLNGYFKEGTRDLAFMAIAATYKAQGYAKETVYHLLKSMAEKQSSRYGDEIFAKEALWEKVENVFDPKWDGGTYSCKSTQWLGEICASLGSHKCKNINEDVTTVSSEDFYDMFSTYAESYEKNKINTGIKELDDSAHIMVGTTNGILAPPAAGKTSLAFSVLNHNSKNGIDNIFFSFDMYSSLVYLRLIQKHTGLEQEKVFHIFKHEKKKMNEIKETIRENYKHTRFCFKSGLSADEIETTITETEEKLGRKVKLVVVDYNELVMTPYSDATASSAYVSQRLRQIANDRSVAIMSLLQPAKLFSNPAEEAKTYQAAKGSGSIAQSLSLMLGLSRPGFSPSRPEDDRFLTINALKNRSGPIFTLNFSWNGLRGDIGELTEEDRIELAGIKEARAKEKSYSEY